MPKITINEIDNTIYGRREVTSNNIVLIPGTAITGPSEPTLLASQTDFKDIFGSVSPDTDSNIATAWDYANNLLMLGMPVLFKRITGSTDGSVSYVKSATASIYAESEDKNITAEDFDIVYTPESGTGSEVTDASLAITYKLLKAVTNITIKINNSSSSEIYSYVKNTDTSAGIQTLNISLAETVPSTGEWIDPNNFTNGDYTISIIVKSADSIDKLSDSFTKKATSPYIEKSDVVIDSVIVATVTAKYGGSYGNTLKCSITGIDGVSTSCYFRVYSNGVLIESKRIATLVPGESQASRTEKLYNGLKSLENSFESVIIAVGDKDNFTLSNTDASLSGGEDADEALVATQIASVFSEYTDKLIYDIKFVTSGGYTDQDSSTAIAKAMIELAEERGDCLAIVDLPLGLPEDNVTTFFNSGDTNSSYATAYAPWCYTKLYDRSEKWCAPSYMFLNALAKSVNSGNPIYLAPAGVKRSQLTNVINTEYQIGSKILENWQSTNPTSINPIMNIYSYGYVIYGQRTLYSTVEDSVGNNKTSALQELSVRIVSNEIKKLIFNTALYLTFDQNNLYTWNEFKSIVEPKLDDMKANGGINDYLVVMDSSTITDDDINSGTIRGSVMISVTRTAENFTIDFTLEPSSVTFDEEEYVIR